MKTRRWAERRPSPPRAPTRPCPARAQAVPGPGAPGARAQGPCRDAQLRGRGRREGLAATQWLHLQSRRTTRRTTRPRGAEHALAASFLPSYTLRSSAELPAARMSTPRGPAEGAPSCPSHVQGQSRAAEAHAPPRPLSSALPRGRPGPSARGAGCVAGPRPARPQGHPLPLAGRRCSGLAPPLPARGRCWGFLILFIRFFFFCLLFHSHVVAPSSSSDVSPTEKSDNPVS